MTQTDFEKQAIPQLDALYGLAVSLTRNKTDADDLVQEAFLKAHRAFNLQFKPGTNMKAWLFTILRNTFINEYRRKKRAAEEPVEEGDNIFSFFNEAQALQKRHSKAVDPEKLNPERLEDHLGDEVMAALATLTDDYREVIYFGEIQEMSYKEMAGILQVPIGTVRSRLARARAAMQKKLWDYAIKSGQIGRPAS